MEEKEIGMVEKYFSHVEVGIIKLSGNIKLGDAIHIKGHTTDFTQNIESMQVEHKTVEQASSGEEVGIKVKERVRPGDKVYLPA
jgi:putative protease